MTEDYCKVWYSKAPYGQSGNQIISGRSRVHGIWVMNKVTVSGTTIPLSRPISLLDASSGNALYKCAFNNPGNSSEIQPPNPLILSENYFGGNGILFKNGVWLSIDSNDQSGSAGTQNAAYIAVLYTGGVNT
tara:strand:+ start:990 stop:1385 length:396 start_codon:yes stop_codon:yes gene_type:complete